MSISKTKRKIRRKSTSNKKRAVYSNEDPTKMFDIIEQLGKGSYGGVVKARDKKDNSIVAIKVVQIETDNTKELVREISILSKCRSKYIVNYCGSYRHENQIWIAMEYCGAGSVADIIKITKKRLKESQIAVIAKHTLSGLKYLHKNNIIHRDIKAGNILLNDLGQCKVCDFGVSSQLAQTISRRNTVIGSPFWMAPEVLKQNDYNQIADIWSLGITIIQMAEGKPPLSDLHPLRALLTIPSNPAPTLQYADDWTQSMHSFLALCLKKDPKQRSSAAELLKHPFIKNAGKKSVIQQLVVNVMPQIEEYRNEKRKEYEIQIAEKKEKEKNNKKKSKKSKKKKKKRIIFNAEPASDDEIYGSPKVINNDQNHNEKEEEEEYDASTMIITENENEQKEDENEQQFATMIMREKPIRNEEEEKNANVDVRSPEYIILPLFTERCQKKNEFELNEYIPHNPTKEQLLQTRKSLWTAYWKDKQIVEDYYIDCRRQIRELLDKMKHQKKKKRKSRKKN